MTTALIATADPTILDDLLRLAAAADVEAAVAREVDQARAAWQHSPLVLVGEDLAEDLARVGSPRRPGVVLVTTRPDDDDVYRLAVDVGAQDVVPLPDAEPWLVDQLAAAAEPASEAAVTLCVIGGRGGAGASVLSSAMALAGMRCGLHTLLVDADPLGGGIDLVLGQEHATGARWPDFVGRHGRLSFTALHGSLPHLDKLTVLSWHRGDAEPIPAAAMQSVLDAAVRGFDLVVVDLPRHLADAATEALLVADQVLLVVPAEVRAVVAAARVATGVGKYAADIRLVVRGPAPGGLKPEVIAGSLDLPLAGALPTDRRIAAALERGELADIGRQGPLGDFCGRFLAGLGRP